MAKHFEVLERRFGNERPGLRLVAAELAAIPVTVVKTDVLAQERKALPVTEEFVLRFVSLGVNSIDAIAQFLGLDVAHVTEAVAAQISENHIGRRSADNALILTLAGREVATTLEAAQPVLRQLPVVFDRLSWSMAEYSERNLITKREAESAGLTLLPAQRSAHIEMHDLSPLEFNRLLSGQRLQVLRVHKIASASKHRFLPVEMLVYADEQRREIELGVCIEDKYAPLHSLELARADAVRRLKLRVGDPVQRPKLSFDLEALRDEALHLEGVRETVTVRPTQLLEHPSVLLDAVELSKNRLLIVSRQARSSVVTGSLIARIEARLRAGVRVDIVVSSGRAAADDYSAAQFDRLRQSFSSFNIRYIEEAHPEIIIYDDKMVVTTFPWLAFRGDSVEGRQFRADSGTFVADKAAVDRMYRQQLMTSNS